MAIDRKEKIVKAAIDLWVKHGAAFTRLSAVAKAAKVPAPLIHYYFKTEEDLHYEIVLRIRDDILDYHLKNITKSTDPVTAFQEYLKGPLLWASHREGHCSIWFYYYYLSTYNPRFRELNSEQRRTGRDRIAMFIYQGIEKSVFKLPDDISVNDLAHEVQAIMNGMLLLYMSENRDKKVDYYIHQQESRIMKLLHVKGA